MIETAMKKIKELCEEKEDENWEFRSFLKACDLDPREIDALVHKLYREVSSQVDCTACANCCKEANFLIKEKDIDRLAARLNLPVEEFKTKYIDDCKDTAAEGYTFNRLPCPFLENNRCTVYNSRPENCRSFPYLHKKDFVFKLINVVHNCSLCPTVFNVYQRLQEELHFQFTDGSQEFEAYSN